METGVTTLVVARYNESLHWLASIDDVVDEVAVYCKSDVPLDVPPGLAARVRVAPLPNVGRESHTYLHHIVSSYDAIVGDPEGITLFYQGDPGNEVVAYTRDGMRDARSVGVNVCHAAQHGNNEWWGAVPLFRNPVYRNCDQRLNAHDEPFGAWFERHLGRPLPSPSPWIIAANVVVRNDRIASHPREFYRALLALVDDHDSPEDGHFFERTWMHVFAA